MSTSECELSAHYLPFAEVSFRVALPATREK